MLGSPCPSYWSG